MSSTAETDPPVAAIRVPRGSSSARVSSSKRLTEAMDGSASPRKPNVATPTRSSAVRTLLVA